MNKEEKQTIKNFVNSFDDAKMLEYSSFRRTLQNVANSGLNLYGFPEVPLRLEWGAPDDPVAYISDSECYINVNSSLDQDLNFQNRKRNAIGKLTHEVFGHGLFSDFSIMNEINNATNFNVLKKYFSHTSLEQLKEIEKYYKQIPGAVNKIFLQLNNIIEDPVIEYLALQRYPGLVDYVEFTKEQLTKNCKSHIEESLSNDMGFMNAFLMQMRNVEVETATLYFPELIKTQVIYDNIENMPHPYQRFEATGYVFAVFWNTLKPIFDAVIEQKAFLDLLQKLDLPRTQNGMANQQNGDDNTTNSSQGSISISCDNNQTTSSSSNKSNNSADESNSSNSENNNDSGNTANNNNSDGKNDDSTNEAVGCAGSNNEDKETEEDNSSKSNGSTGDKEDNSNADTAEDTSNNNNTDESNAADDEKDNSLQGGHSTNDDITDTQDEDEDVDESNSDLNNSNDEKSNDSQNNESQDEINNANQSIDNNQVDPNTQREFEKKLSQMEKEVGKSKDEISTEITAEHPELLKQAEHFELNNGNGFVHEGYEIAVNEIKTSYNAVQNYNMLFKPEYKRVSQVLAKKLNQIIKQKRTYKALYELEEGSIIDINAYAQGSEKVFMDYSSPYKTPVCAISIMIDLSGSMYCGDRLQSAMLTAMVLENFARTSKIPIEIYGHHCIWSQITTIERFVGFNEKSSVANASKLISCLTVAGGNNRDGLAIRYGLAKLKKRPEKSKLMFILSDGEPNNYNYGTTAMKIEMPDIYKIAKKYNVQIIPVAIGDDINSLRNIYGNNVVDGRNLNKLPQMLANKTFKNINKLL